MVPLELHKHDTCMMTRDETYIKGLTSSPQLKQLEGANRPSQQRSKRTKYTSIACNRCKEKKVKCTRPIGQRECQGCMTAGMPCVDVLSSRRARQDDKNSTKVTNLKRLVDQLRQEVVSLSSDFRELMRKAAPAELLADSLSSNCQYLAMTDTASQEPKDSQFFGQTRSDFSLSVAKSSLISAGVSTTDCIPTSTSSSIASSPREETWRLVNGDKGCRALSHYDPVLSIGRSEIQRLMEVYHQELHSVYPVFDTVGFVDTTIQLLYDHQHKGIEGLSATPLREAYHKDLRLLKIALAASIVVEAHGKNELGQRLVTSIECDTLHISRNTTIDLREVQILTIMSIYYFHCDEELLAWRIIGVAARQALEMGLHQKNTLLATFRDPKDQMQAIKTFWCVYALDKCWSIGINLPFVLVDRDIDPELPELPPECSYLGCLVGYGKLYSKLWEALPPLGSPLTNIPNDQVLFLNFLVQNWISSIPPDLHFQHPRLGLDHTSEPRTLQLQRALLYLRGNHIKTLLYRHYVLSTGQIYSDTEKAQLVVDVTEDSICLQAPAGGV